MRQYLIFALLVASMMSCGGKGTPGYEAAKMTLEEQERSSPTSFLTLESKVWINLLDQTVIEGYIGSSATVAKFKDVVLTVNFLTKTDTKIGSKNFIIYEFIFPGQETHFKIKMDAPIGTEKVGLVIDRAEIVD